jgi:hypothetical protein
MCTCHNVSHTISFEDVPVCFMIITLCFLSVPVSFQFIPVSFLFATVRFSFVTFIFQQHTVVLFVYPPERENDKTALQQNAGLYFSVRSGLLYHLGFYLRPIAYGIKTLDGIMPACHPLALRMAGRP